MSRLETVRQDWADITDKADGQRVENVPAAFLSAVRFMVSNFCEMDGGMRVSVGINKQYDALFASCW